MHIIDSHQQLTPHICSNVTSEKLPQLKGRLELQSAVDKSIVAET
jgi:hypothetical protein